jgi:hypothetical protein
MNEEGMRKYIRTLLDEVQNEADPALLNRCRSLFRQEVSFFRRSYMAAYLLLLAKEGKSAVVSSGANNAGQRNAGQRGQRDQKPEESRSKGRGREQAEAPRFLSEDESVRLFISIGRNRKVFARDILALISAVAQVARDDIGAVRILDNFSFVQIRTAAADTVIEALNGHSFRGRTLTVNYARSRREDEEDNPDSRPEKDHDE